MNDIKLTLLPTSLAVVYLALLIGPDVTHCRHHLECYIHKARHKGGIMASLYVGIALSVWVVFGTIGIVAMWLLI